MSTMSLSLSLVVEYMMQLFLKKNLDKKCISLLFLSSCIILTGIDLSDSSNRLCYAIARSLLIFYCSFYTVIKNYFFYCVFLFKVLNFHQCIVKNCR